MFTPTGKKISRINIRGACGGNMEARRRMSCKKGMSMGAVIDLERKTGLGTKLNSGAKTRSGRRMPVGSKIASGGKIGANKKINPIAISSSRRNMVKGEVTDSGKKTIANPKLNSRAGTSTGVNIVTEKQYICGTTNSKDSPRNTKECPDQSGVEFPDLRLQQGINYQTQLHPQLIHSRLHETTIMNLTPHISDSSSYISRLAHGSNKQLHPHAFRQPQNTQTLHGHPSDHRPQTENSKDEPQQFLNNHITCGEKPPKISKSKHKQLHHEAPKNILEKPSIPSKKLSNIGMMPKFSMNFRRYSSSNKTGKPKTEDITRREYEEIDIKGLFEEIKEMKAEHKPTKG